MYTTIGNIWSQYASCGTSSNIGVGYAWSPYSCENSSTTGEVYIPIKGYDSCGTSTLNWNYNIELTTGTATATVSSINYHDNWKIYKPTLKEHISKIIKSRCSPLVITKRKSMNFSNDIREQRARETLKRIIGPQKFIGFIKHGFISAKGKSGLVYQIFPGSGITHVFEKGTLIERLCVVLKGNFPPTDSLIMRFLLILNNEQQFRSLSIKHSVYKECSHQNGPVETKPLAEIFNLLKNKVA